MITEVAILHLKHGGQTAFEKNMKLAVKYSRSIKVYAGHSLLKCMEHDHPYIPLVKREKIEDHTVGFRESAAYVHWKNLLHHYDEPFPIVAYFVKMI